MSEMPQQSNGYLPLCLHPEDVLSNEPTNFYIYKTETNSQTWRLVVAKEEVGSEREFGAGRYL